MKRRRSYELVAALAAVTLITGWYVYVARNGAPRPSGVLGHGLGVIGFLMMLSTETLYSLRKHVPSFTLGSMNHWLQAHVFTGIVGPYLVLLHSAGKFNGLAGVVAGLTVVLVVSGFIGRYIYTGVPRTLDGAEVTVRDLQEQIVQADQRLRALGSDGVPAGALTAATGSEPVGWLGLLGRNVRRWQQRRRVRQALQDLETGANPQTAQLHRLCAERHRLQTQIESLAGTRRLLSWWHVIHVPLALVVFTLAFIHVGAALYYATLLR